MLPIAPKPFGGHVGLRESESTLDFPPEVKAPKGAPNILLIMPDDVGFGASSAFGGPVPTPAIERVAEAGIRYNQFHTTALCSPTRAALISGRNHHSNATGVIMEVGTGFPGYNSLNAEEKRHRCGDTQAERIQHCMVWQEPQRSRLALEPGWAVRPVADRTRDLSNSSVSSVVTRVSSHQPSLMVRDPVEPEKGEDEYHLDVDMADRAITYIREQNALAPDKPFFIYYAPGTSHAPHHAPKEWIEKFKGQFDQGWDKVREETFARQKKMGIIPKNTKLTPRPDKLRAWDSLNDKQKELYARMMEVYAAALSHMDHQIDRILDADRGNR